MKKVLVALLALFLVAGSATAASRYLITSTRQIKPSVLAQLRSAPPRVVHVNGPTAYLCPNSATATNCVSGHSTATCPAGTTVMGGGWDGESSPPNNASVAYNYPPDSTSWEVVMSNNDPNLGGQFHAVATCLVP